MRPISKTIVHNTGFITKIVVTKNSQNILTVRWLKKINKKLEIGLLLSMQFWRYFLGSVPSVLADYSHLHPWPPLSSWQGQTAPIRQNQASPFASQGSIQVVHCEGQRLHNELENVSDITPHLNSGFSRTSNRCEMYPRAHWELSWRMTNFFEPTVDLGFCKDRRAELRWNTQ